MTWPVSAFITAMDLAAAAVIRQDSPDKYSVAETVKTLPRAKTLALDPKTHQLFLSTAPQGSLKCWWWESK
jgi:hypothetical protein